MYRLGQTKLALDEAVAGDDTVDGDDDDKAEKRMKTSLLSVLREQFEKEELRQCGGGKESALVADDSMDVETEPSSEQSLIFTG
jgi:SWI/SNF-related matrix-associated actin-dependent regulator of chromatin subfamily A containing DEAD/H box 1